MKIVSNPVVSANIVKNKPIFTSNPTNVQEKQGSEQVQNVTKDYNDVIEDFTSYYDLGGGP